MNARRHWVQRIRTWRRLIGFPVALALVGFVLAFGSIARADTIEVELRPLANQDPNNVKLWEVCYQSDVSLHRLTVGAQKPTGYTGSMDWVDCLATGVPCSGVAGTIFADTYVDIETGLSFAEEVSAGTDTLFLVLSGNTGSLASALPTAIGDWVCLARLEFSPLGLDVDPADPLLSADLPMLVNVFDPNAYTLDFLGAIGSSCSEPVVKDDGISLIFCESGATGGGLSSPASSVTVASGIPDDSDGDLRRNFEDNCVYTPNADQLDQGGFQTLVADGVGDMCQCGEGEANGIVDQDGDTPDEDLTAMLDYLKGSPPGGFDVTRCSLQNPSTCTIHDAALLHQAVNGGGAPANQCTAFTN